MYQFSKIAKSDNSLHPTLGPPVDAVLEADRGAAIGDLEAAKDTNPARFSGLVSHRKFILKNLFSLKSFKDQLIV